MSGNKKSGKARMVIFLLGIIFSCTRPVLAPLDLNYPTRPMELPGDLAAHKWAQIEWWYYTGHLKSEDGKNYGFELTFFQHRTDLDQHPGMKLGSAMPLVYMAHLALVDEASGKYLHQLIGLPAGKNAGASEEEYQVVLGKWRASGDEQIHHISAAAEKLGVDLELKPLKPAALHSENGIVAKGEGLANYYMSYPRMELSGTIFFEARRIPVQGIGWFDHEYGYMGLRTGLGWDWFSIQLDDNTEYMIYTIRRPDGAVEPLSRACRIDRDGKEECLLISEARINQVGLWLSPHTNSAYPSGWQILIPAWGVDLIVIPTVSDQEFQFMGLGYWEGSCKVLGKPANGLAYVELVGYSKSKTMEIIDPNKK